MEKSAVRQVYSRGNSAETPNWRFTLSTQIPREQSPELCERLGFIVIERGGGHYYYPDYKNNRMAAAFEWYQPYKGWKFGYKFGVEFWVEDGNLEQMGAYALYGEDHPKHGSAPEFNGSQQSRIERNVIGTIQLALEWKDKLSEPDFYAVHYLQLQSRGVLKTSSFQIPSLDAVVLPTVQMGKENARVRR